MPKVIQTDAGPVLVLTKGEYEKNEHRRKAIGHADQVQAGFAQDRQTMAAAIQAKAAADEAERVKAEEAQKLARHAELQKAEASRGAANPQYAMMRSMGGAEAPAPDLVKEHYAPEKELGAYGSGFAGDTTKEYEGVEALAYGAGHLSRSIPVVAGAGALASVLQLNPLTGMITGFAADGALTEALSQKSEGEGYSAKDIGIAGGIGGASGLAGGVAGKAVGYAAPAIGSKLAGAPSHIIGRNIGRATGFGTRAGAKAGPAVGRVGAELTQELGEGIAFEKMESTLQGRPFDKTAPLFDAALFGAYRGAGKLGDSVRKGKAVDTPDSALAGAVADAMEPEAPTVGAKARGVKEPILSQSDLEWLDRQVAEAPTLSQGDLSWLDQQVENANRFPGDTGAEAIRATENPAPPPPVPPQYAGALAEIAQQQRTRPRPGALPIDTANQAISAAEAPVPPQYAGALADIAGQTGGPRTGPALPASTFYGPQNSPLSDPTNVSQMLTAANRPHTSYLKDAERQVVPQTQYAAPGEQVGFFDLPQRVPRGPEYGPQTPSGVGVGEVGGIPGVDPAASDVANIGVARLGDALIPKPDLSPPPQVGVGEVGYPGAKTKPTKKRGRKKKAPEPLGIEEEPIGPELSDTGRPGQRLSKTQAEKLAERKAKRAARKAEREAKKAAEAEAKKAEEAEAKKAEEKKPSESPRKPEPAPVETKEAEAPKSPEGPAAESPEPPEPPKKTRKEKNDEARKEKVENPSKDAPVVKRAKGTKKGEPPIYDVTVDGESVKITSTAYGKKKLWHFVGDEGVDAPSGPSGKTRKELIEKVQKGERPTTKTKEANVEPPKKEAAPEPEVTETDPAPAKSEAMRLLDSLPDAKDTTMADHGPDLGKARLVNNERPDIGTPKSSDDLHGVTTAKKTEETKQRLAEERIKKARDRKESSGLGKGRPKSKKAEPVVRAGEAEREVSKARLNIIKAEEARAEAPSQPDSFENHIGDLEGASKDTLISTAKKEGLRPHGGPKAITKQIGVARAKKAFAEAIQDLDDDITLSKTKLAAAEARLSRATGAPSPASAAAPDPLPAKGGERKPSKKILELRDKHQKIKEQADVYTRNAQQVPSRTKGLVGSAFRNLESSLRSEFPDITPREVSRFIETGQFEPGGKVFRDNGPKGNSGAALRPSAALDDIKKAVDKLTGAERRKAMADFIRARDALSTAIHKADRKDRPALRRKLRVIAEEYGKSVNVSFDKMIEDARAAREIGLTDAYRDTLEGLKRPELAKMAKDLGLPARGTNDRLADNIAAERARRDMAVMPPKSKREQKAMIGNVQNMVAVSQKLSGERGSPEGTWNKLQKTVFDVSHPAKAALRQHDTPEGVRAAMRLDLLRGADSSILPTIEQRKTEIWGGLSHWRNTNHVDVLGKEALFDKRGNVSEVDVLNEVIAIKASADLARRRPDVLNPHDLTQADFDAALSGIANTKKGRDMLRRADKFFESMREDVLVPLHEAGILSDKQFAKLDIAEAYAPRVVLREGHDTGIEGFVHQIDPSETYKSARGQEVTVTSSGVDHMKDGTVKEIETDFKHLLENLLKRTHTRIKKNETNVALHEFIEKNPEAAKEIGLSVRKKLKGNKLPDLRPGNTVISFMMSKQAPVDVPKEPKPVDDGPRVKIEEDVDLDMDVPMEQVVEKVDLEVPRWFADAWVQGSPMLAANKAEFIRKWSGSTLLKASVTGSFNPSFAVRNIPRDTMMLLMHSDQYSAMLPVATLELGADMKETFKDSFDSVFKGDPKGIYADYIKSGGGQETLASDSRVNVSDKLPAVNRVLDTINSLNQFSEVWVRTAHMNRALKNGLSPEEATYVARDFLDFRQGGDMVKAMDTFIPFLNASSQGLRTVARSAYRDPTRFMLAYTQVMAAGAGLYIWNNSEENRTEHAKISPARNANNAVVQLPPWFSRRNKETGEMERIHLELAKDQMAKPVMLMGEVIARHLSGDDSIDPNILDDVILGSTVFADISPNIGPVGSAIMALMNIDSWRGDKVWKGEDVSIERFGPDDRSLEYNDRTSSFFRDAGQVTKMSPERLRAVRDKIFGSNNPFGAIGGFGYETLVQAWKDGTITEEQQGLLFEAAVEAAEKVGANLIRTSTDYDASEGEAIRKDTRRSAVETATAARAIDAMAENIVEGGEFDLEKAKEIVANVHPSKRKRIGKRLVERVSWADQSPEIRAQWDPILNIESNRNQAAAWFHRFLTKGEKEKQLLAEGARALDKPKTFTDSMKALIIAFPEEFAKARKGEKVSLDMNDIIPIVSQTLPEVSPEDLAEALDSPLMD